MATTTTITTTTISGRAFPRSSAVHFKDDSKLRGAGCPRSPFLYIQVETLQNAPQCCFLIFVHKVALHCTHGRVSLWSLPDEWYCHGVVLPWGGVAMGKTTACSATCTATLDVWLCPEDLAKTGQSDSSTTRCRHGFKTPVGLAA